MLSLEKIPENGKFKGQYTVNRISEDETMLEIQNHEDGSTFNMKVSTFNNRKESGKLTAYDDDSFDLQTANVTKITWKEAS